MLVLSVGRERLLSASVCVCWRSEGGMHVPEGGVEGHTGDMDICGKVNFGNGRLQYFVMLDYKFQIFTLFSFFLLFLARKSLILDFARSFMQKGVSRRCIIKS